MSSTEVWRTAAQVDACIQGMGTALQRLLDVREIPDPLMIGIHTGGVWVAERLHQQLGIADPLGKLDISFYRDDFTRIGMHPQVRPSQLPVPLDNRHIVLVDDVVQTGRTIRAALNVLFDYGRPASVLLAALAERDDRELPIEPNLVGLRPRLQPGQQIKLIGADPLVLILGQIPAERQKSGTMTAPAS